MDKSIGYRSIIVLLFAILLFVCLEKAEAEEIIGQHDERSIFSLPSSLKIIDSSAFEGTNPSVIEFPESIIEVKSLAFSNIQNNILVDLTKCSDSLLANETFYKTNFFFYDSNESLNKDWLKTIGDFWSINDACYLTLVSLKNFGGEKRFVRLTEEVTDKCTQKSFGREIDLETIFNKGKRPEVHVLALDFP